MARRPPGSPLLQRPGAGGLGPLPPPPSHPGAPPPHTLHLQGNLVLRAGALNFLGGREEGRAAPREPPPGGSSEDGADTSWAAPSPPPPPTRTSPPTSAAVQLVPKHQKPQAGFGHTISWPPRPPPILHGWDTFRSEHPPHSPPPPLGIALLLLWNASTHLSIRPSVHPPSSPLDRLAPLAGWAPPKFNVFRKSTRTAGSSGRTLRSPARPRKHRLESLTSRSPSEGRMHRAQTRPPGPGRAEGGVEAQGH